MREKAETHMISIIAAYYIKVGWENRIIPHTRNNSFSSYVAR